MNKNEAGDIKMLTSEDKKLIKNENNLEELFIKLRDNNPYFTKEEIEKGLKGKFEDYSELDKLGRCGEAFACIVKKESEIFENPKNKNPKHNSRIKPTAWKSIGCDFIKDGECLYNRCHLIGRQLATKKANRKGLITGTRWFNVEGMFKFENEAAKCIKDNPNHHILYRVTPYFKGDDLLAYGVQMEMLDIDDEEKLSYNVFVYNRQRGFTIDYKNGDVYSDNPLSLPSKRSGAKIYIIDRDTNKFHKESCASICDIKNKKYFAGKEQTIKEEYCKCGICIH